MNRYFCTAILAALSIGSLVYCALAIRAVLLYLKSAAPSLTNYPPVSILRPLAGAEDNTETNLRSVFSQKYPAEFEVLLSVHEQSDPAAEIARRVMAEFAHVPSQLVIAGLSPLPNAKVWSLRALLPKARYEHLLMTDSDIRLEPDCLQIVISELAGVNVALVTCPYRAVAGPKFWPRLEALGLNTAFLAGMLTQRMLNGMDFAIGCTIATRRAELASIGGFEYLQGFLAEDFMMGNLMRRAGLEVVLSRSVIQHYIGDENFMQTWKHRLRWARSTRRSRPWGYLGEAFTKPFAWCLLLAVEEPRLWTILLLALIMRFTLAWLTAFRVLHDRAIRLRWWLLPIEDIADLAAWFLGMFGKKILWRGRWLVVGRDGRFQN